jgi:hypothetical protein
MELPFERDLSAYGDLAEGDDRRCATACASNEDEQPHVQCVLGYLPTVIVAFIPSDIAPQWDGMPLPLIHPASNRITAPDRYVGCRRSALAQTERSAESDGAPTCGSPPVHGRQVAQGEKTPRPRRGCFAY